MTHARTRASTTVLLDKNGSIPGFDTLSSNNEHSNPNLTPQSKRRWFAFSKAASQSKVPIPPEPETSHTYLKLTTSYSRSTSGKKKRLQKPCNITLTSTRISFEKDTSTPLLLHSLCTLQATPTEKKKSAETKAEALDSLLICDENLTRIWIHFETEYECMEWAITIENLLHLTNKSLLDPNVKITFLKELYFHREMGGTIKVGDDEEWSYIRDNSEMTCILSERNEITGFKFSYDGVFLLPKGDGNILGGGEWDGTNIYWYTHGMPDIEDSKLRRKIADMSFHWIAFQEEFRPLQGNSIIDDDYNTWKWARVFLTRKKQSAHDWVQKEGEVPLPITMFLCMHKWASVTEPPPMQVLESSEEE